LSMHASKTVFVTASAFISNFLATHGELESKNYHNHIAPHKQPYALPNL
jgi:hypothetical protein